MRKIRDEIKDLRQFGVTLAGILIIFGVIHFFKGRMLLFRYFLSFGTIILALALIAPKVLRGVYSIFLKVAHAIGWFNTRAILVIIYFLLICPISVVMKILGKDPLKRKMEKDSSTYWIRRAALKPTKEQLEKQF